MLGRFLESMRQLAGQNFERKKFLLAVSGGADSTVMALLFKEAQLDFSIAHCNFHLRGADSDRDMNFVKNLSQKLGVSLFVNEFDTLEIKKTTKKSVEMVARDLRYAWFGEIMGGYDFLVTAHNANDAAETQLLNIIRGAGLEGLRSIPDKNGYIIRPMLSFSAKEIRTWAKTNDIAFVEDCTNSDESIKRNRVRHSVIPIFEELNPNFIKTNSRNRQIFSRQYCLYRFFVQKEVDNVEILDGNILRIDKKKLYNSFDPQLILYEILSNYGFSGDTCLKLAHMAETFTGKKFYSETHELLVERDFLIIRKKESKDPIDAEISDIEDLLKYFAIEEHHCEEKIKFEANPFVFYIPEEKLKFPLQIRGWRNGDFFYPFGANGKKKLSDFFINEKVSLFDKEKIPLLCKDDSIMWVIGYRSDERFKVEKKSKKYYKITYLAQNDAQ